MKARRELWALACSLGPRAAGQLRLMAVQMARHRAHGRRRGRSAEQAERGERRWWHLAAGLGPARVIPAEAARPRGPVVMGAES